jgi:hypothetical protein
MSALEKDKKHERKWKSGHSKIQITTSALEKDKKHDHVSIEKRQKAREEVEE